MYQKSSLLMEWCLECHRNPELFVRPRDAVYQMDYEPPPISSSSGTAREGVRHREPDELLDLPPVIRHASMSAAKTFDLPSIRARFSAVRGRQFWRSFEELAETPEFTSFVQREFPQQLGVAGSGGPPRLPQADGRLARACRGAAPARASRMN